MNTQEYISFIPVFIEKLKTDGMSKDVISTNIWITNHFKQYCLNNNIENIDMEVIKEFYQRQYDIDIYNICCGQQTILRRPLLILMEFYQTGSYFKTHQKSNAIKIPDNFIRTYETIQLDFINNLNICVKSKKRKLWIIADFINYLSSNNINSLKDIKISNVSEYIETLSEKYSKATIKIQKTVLRETLNWLYQQNMIKFNGRQVFPLIKADTRNKLLSTYSEDEIKRILDVIDNTTKSGKCIFLVVSILAYYGLRVGDIINLKFENIDFENNSINIIQQKTLTNLTLPLIDEIKYPLIDYIKNGRPNSKDKEYVLSTMYAPYTKFKETSSIHKFLTRTMDIAGINYENRHHGPHAFRHSLATNMINKNVPLSAIGNVLGHSSTKITNIYITKDTTHLKELTLEVPNEI